MSEYSGLGRRDRQQMNMSYPSKTQLFLGKHDAFNFENFNMFLQATNLPQRTMYAYIAYGPRPVHTVFSSSDNPQRFRGLPLVTAGFPRFGYRVLSTMFPCNTMSLVRATGKIRVSTGFPRVFNGCSTGLLQEPPLCVKKLYTM